MTIGTFPKYLYPRIFLKFFGGFVYRKKFGDVIICEFWCLDNCYVILGECPDEFIIRLKNRGNYYFQAQIGAM